MNMNVLENGVESYYLERLGGMLALLWGGIWCSVGMRLEALAFISMSYLFRGGILGNTKERVVVGERHDADHVSACSP